jgi:hypothetical protein
MIIYLLIHITIYCALVNYPASSLEGAFLGWFQVDSPVIIKRGPFWDGFNLTPLQYQRGAFLGRSQIDSPVKVKRGPFWDGFSLTPL